MFQPWPPYVNGAAEAPEVLPAADALAQILDGVGVDPDATFSLAMWHPPATTVFVVYLPYCARCHAQYQFRSCNLERCR